MSNQLQIVTPFGELSELVEHFSQRVAEGRLMLPYPQPVEEGAWVQFQLTFADGAPAFEGTGKITGAYDNGEEHPAEYRFDLVLEELSFEGTNEVVYERMIMARDSLAGAEPGTGEVQVPDEVPAAPAAETAGDVDLDAVQAADDDAAPVEDVQAADEASGEGGFVDAETSIAAVEPPPAREAGRPPAAPPARRPRVEAVHRGQLPSPHSADRGALRRPTHPSAWSPEPQERPPAAESNGLFDYEAGLPRPAAPPRPEMDAELRVAPAPAGPPAA